MTEGRLTQGLVLAAGATDAPPSRVTQAVALVLGIPRPPARITQAPALVLGKLHINPRITQATALVLAASVPCLTHWAQCWRIERADGAVFAFTSLDVEVPFRGETYTPCSSLSASAVELGTQGGAPGNQELAGIIDADAISETDLFNGDFDGARVEVWLVPWLNAGGETPRRLTAGVWGNQGQERGSFTAEVLTAGVMLTQQPLLSIAKPGCDWMLGDAHCTVDLAPLTVTGTVDGAFGPPHTALDRRRRFADSGRDEDDGWFDLGMITWTGGANAGARSKVKSFDGASGTFVLWEAMLHPIQAGDTYTASPGCDKSKAACQDKFDNYTNFGGLPDVPGKDSINQTPDAKAEGP